MASLTKAYTLGCLSICLQEDKDLANRNLGVKLMAVADKKSKELSQAFSAGRYDTAVALSVRRSKLLKK
jgi:hypothetical protein